jgi:adenylate cyclase
MKDMAIVAFILPALSALIEIRAAWITVDNVLKTYVGAEPRRAILAGNVKRGQVSTIRSAILFADMRGSSDLTATMSAVAAVNLFNQFFGCLVPPIEANGGEVLKYLGTVCWLFSSQKQPVNVKLISMRYITGRSTGP